MVLRSQTLMSVWNMFKENNDGKPPARAVTANEYK
jgi:hypothetical protein